MRYSTWPDILVLADLKRAFFLCRRICPGADLANHFIALSVARLVHCYDVAFADGSVGFGQIKSGLAGVEMHVEYPDVVFTRRRNVEELLASQE